MSHMSTKPAYQSAKILWFTPRSSMTTCSTETGISDPEIKWNSGTCLRNQTPTLPLLTYSSRFEITCGLYTPGPVLCQLQANRWRPIPLRRPLVGDECRTAVLHPYASHMHHFQTKPNWTRQQETPRSLCGLKFWRRLKWSKRTQRSGNNIQKHGHILGDQK